MKFGVYILFAFIITGAAAADTDATQAFLDAVYRATNTYKTAISNELKDAAPLIDSERYTELKSEYTDELSTRVAVAAAPAATPVVPETEPETPDKEPEIKTETPKPAETYSHKDCQDSPNGFKKFVCQFMDGQKEYANVDLVCTADTCRADLANKSVKCSKKPDGGQECHIDTTVVQPQPEAVIQPKTTPQQSPNPQNALTDWLNPRCADSCPTSGEKCQKNVLNESLTLTTGFSVNADFWIYCQDHKYLPQSNDIANLAKYCTNKQEILRFDPENESKIKKTYKICSYTGNPKFESELYSASCQGFVKKAGAPLGSSIDKTDYNDGIALCGTLGKENEVKKAACDWSIKLMTDKLARYTMDEQKYNTAINYCKADNREDQLRQAACDGSVQNTLDKGAYTFAVSGGYDKIMQLCKPVNRENDMRKVICGMVDESDITFLSTAKQSEMLKYCTKEIDAKKNEQISNTYTRN